MISKSTPAEPRSLLEELRRLAEAATPGPWGVGEGSDPPYPVITTPSGHGLVAELWGGEKAERGPADAAYIAAVSPDVILRLLDLLQEKVGSE